MPKDKNQTGNRNGQTNVQELQFVSLKDIKADPKKNPRKKEDEKALAELRASIANQGIIIPLMVYPNNGGYELICGFRRLKVARQLDMKEIPVIIRRDLDDQGIAEIRTLENLQRANLDIIDEAIGFKDMVKKFSWRIEDVADKVGKSERYVAKRLVLLDAPDYVQQALSQGKITIAHAIIIRCIQDKAEQKEMFKRAAQFNWSARELRGHSQKRHINQNTPFDITECRKCRWYGPNQRQLLFDEIGKVAGEQICGNKSCFNQKMQEARDEIAKKYREQGLQVKILDQYASRDYRSPELTKKSKRSLIDPKKCDKCEHRVIEIKECHDGDFGKRDLCTKPKCSNWKVDKTEAARQKKEREYKRQENEKLDQMMVRVREKLTSTDLNHLIIHSYLMNRSKGDPLLNAFIKKYEIDRELLKKADNWRYGEEIYKIMPQIKANKKLPEMVKVLAMLDVRYHHTDLLTKMERPMRKRAKKKG